MSTQPIPSFPTGQTNRPQGPGSGRPPGIGLPPGSDSTDSFNSRPPTSEEIAAALQHADDISAHSNAVLNTLQQQEALEKALNNDPVALVKANLLTPLPTFQPLDSPVNNPDPLIRAVQERQATLNKWGVLAPVYRFFQPSSLDHFSPSSIDTLKNLSNLREDGISNLGDYSVQQNDALKTSQNTEYSAMLASQKQVAREALATRNEQLPPAERLTPEQIEYTVQSTMDKMQPAVENELQKAGFSPVEIQALYKKLNLPQANQP